MDPASATDQELIERIASRDSTALDEVYRRYSRPVYSLAYRVLSDGAAAEDVVQEVFLKLWRQPESYNPHRGSLGPWLLSVTHNRAIDVLRRRRVRDEYQLPETLELDQLVVDTSADPSDVASMSEAGDAIRRALAQIPEAQRRAIEMAFFQGKTHAEISEELGEPLGTAKTRIRLGMRKLRSLLEREGVVTRTP